VSVLVVAQSSSEIPEGLMNNPAFQSWERGFRLFTNATRVRKRALRVPNILLSWALKQAINSNKNLAEFSLIICVIIPTISCISYKERHTRATQL
jgi:hypothetical protein